MLVGRSAMLAVQASDGGGVESEAESGASEKDESERRHRSAVRRVTKDRSRQSAAIRSRGPYYQRRINHGADGARAGIAINNNRMNNI